MTHRTFGRRGHRSEDVGTIDDLRGTAVEGRFIEAAREVSEAFRAAGVRHVLVGGLAVGVRGYPRWTKDVDFLVGEEAFDHHGMVVSPKAGLPIKYGDVDVDWVSMDEADRGSLDGCLVLPGRGEVPVIGAAPLIFMKLLAGRQRDLTDVVEMLKAGASAEEASDFVVSNKPSLMNKLERAMLFASEESEGES